jgi:glucuronate isomerase
MEFITDNFLLENNIAEQLYHDYAKAMPIIDYHNHLNPKCIATNHLYENLTQLWLDGDHYKWRAMRAFGIDEHYITGSANDEEKFEKWAQTVPYTLRNPLFHWTHLELKRYFNIDELLNKNNAKQIFEHTKSLIADRNDTVVNLLSKMNVEVLCTTDDPLDNLEHHKQIAENKTSPKVFPTFRPDSFFNTENLEALKSRFETLSKLSNIEIKDFDSFIEAIATRYQHFHDYGCRLSDKGIGTIPFESYSASELNTIISAILEGKSLSQSESNKYITACLVEFAKIEFDKGWVQQFHLGALRNNNTRLKQSVGADAGVDSIGDFQQAETMSKLFDALDKQEKLPKTIVYNLNPSQNEVFATMAGNFNDGSVKGKMQYGAGWWFLDQLDGMEKQLNTLSNMGLLSCFVGMLTDSRSFLSFPRHEYFRRLLCNILGKEMKKGLIPNDMEFVGNMVKDICYNNAKQYFNFENV